MPKQSKSQLTLFPVEDNTPSVTAAARVRSDLTPAPEAKATTEQRRNGAKGKSPPRQTKPANKRPVNIHHHVIKGENIIACFGTLSEALHRQQAERQQAPNDATTIESYAGNAACQRIARQQPANAAMQLG